MATPENPFGFEPQVLEALAETSSKMYDVFYDLLADYQFDFSPEEKTWMIERLFHDVTVATAMGAAEE